MSARGVARTAASCLALALAASQLHGQADRTRPPRPGPVRELMLPPVERLTLSNGVGVLLVGMHEAPVVEVILAVRAGAIVDPAGREGTAAMTADMLDEGAAGKDALALADAVDFLGATLGAGSTWDAATVRLRVPVARLEAALALMADVALRPAFPEAELARLRKEALTDLLQARDEPGAIASRALAQAVFGPAHRYGKPQAGDAAQIASFTVADLRVFHAARYVPGAASLVVVGDVTAGGPAALEKAFGSWSGAAAARRAAAPCPAPKQLTSRCVWLVDKKDAAQSSLRLGRIGPSWPDPAYAPNEVMNTLLGGSFTSRLNDNLREQHGYAYGAGSGFRRNLAPAACSSSRPTSRPTRPARRWARCSRSWTGSCCPPRLRRWSAHAATRRSAMPETSRRRARLRSVRWTRSSTAFPTVSTRRSSRRRSRPTRRGCSRRPARRSTGSASRWSWSGTAPRSRRRCGPSTSARSAILSVDDVDGVAPTID